MVTLIVLLLVVLWLVLWIFFGACCLRLCLFEVPLGVVGVWDGCKFGFKTVMGCCVFVGCADYGCMFGGWLFMYCVWWCGVYVWFVSLPVVLTCGKFGVCCLGFSFMILLVV